MNKRVLTDVDWYNRVKGGRREFVRQHQRHVHKNPNKLSKAKGKNKKTNFAKIRSVSGLAKAIASLGSANARFKIPDNLMKIKEYNHKSYDEEWIADLDNEDGEIVIDDVVFSDESDESHMNWSQEKGDEDRQKCVGYVHYHPPTTDKRATADDFLLALDVDRRRDMKNKEKFGATMFGVTQDDNVKFYFLKPRRDSTRERLEQIQEEGKDMPNNQYFSRLEAIKNDMKRSGELRETGWIDIDDGQNRRKSKEELVAEMKG